MGAWATFLKQQALVLRNGPARKRSICGDRKTTEGATCKQASDEPQSRPAVGDVTANREAPRRVQHNDRGVRGDSVLTFRFLWVAPKSRYQNLL
jgi:hypothetical protein